MAICRMILAELLRAVGADKASPLECAPGKARCPLQYLFHLMVLILTLHPFPQLKIITQTASWVSPISFCQFSSLRKNKNSVWVLRLIL